MLDEPARNLDFSPRLHNALNAAYYTSGSVAGAGLTDKRFGSGELTVRDLRNDAEEKGDQFCALRNFGKKSLAELREKLGLEPVT